MKLRIRGNSIRIRLQRDEIDHLALAGKVAECLQLGPAPGDVLEYSLSLHAVAEPAIRRTPLGIAVEIPASWAEAFATTPHPGFRSDVAVMPNVYVRLSVEKDYQCLVERPDEDDSQSFPHPAGSPCAQESNRK